MSMLYKTLFLKIGKKHKMFQKKILWKIFRPKGEEVTAQQIKLHDKELHDFWPLPNIIRTTT